MRVSKVEAEKNRARMIRAAARQLRERGIEGVGVDALAKAAGLTHGSVYSHFKSKDNLTAAAIAHAFEISFRDWCALTNGFPPDEAFQKLVRIYVSRYLRDNPGKGCSLALLGSRADRGGRELRGTFAEGVRQMIAIVMSMSGDIGRRDRRAKAIARCAAMVGSIVMARAACADQDLSDEILRAVRADLISGRNSHVTTGPRHG